MRYAIYYTPPRDHELTLTAAHWLGRSPFEHDPVPIDHGYSAHLVAPSRYGFHGTLKAPFRLAVNVTETELLNAFDAFLTRPRVIPEISLRVGALGSFLALIPNDTEVDDLRALSRDCVLDFEPFRAPLTDAEIARRNPNLLPPLQLNYLHRYGYPHVFEAFRFHMTLTSAIDDAATQSEIQNHLTDRFSKLLASPLRMSTLAIFVEKEPGGQFRVLRIGEMTDQQDMYKRVGNE
ncbi:MAG: DUF1045 domain-containing protein [Pseudomonadota bacterium]